MRWKIIGVLGSLIVVVSLALMTVIVTSDGSVAEEYRKEMDIKEIKMDINNPIDWNRLQKKNANIYAWVYLPETNIDYPILQSGKNQPEDYYLNHGIDDSYLFAGSIYTQKKNNKTFKDPVTVLYGHNMINGSMFSDIRKFEDKKFFKQHKRIYIYLPDKILTYQIFAYCISDNKNILETYNCNEEYGFLKLIKSSKVSGIVRKNVNVTVKNNVIVLSTCSASGNSRRLLFGVLEDEQDTTNKERED